MIAKGYTKFYNKIMRDINIAYNEGKQDALKGVSKVIKGFSYDVECCNCEDKKLNVCPHCEDTGLMMMTPTNILKDKIKELLK